MNMLKKFFIYFSVLVLVTFLIMVSLFFYPENFGQKTSAKDWESFKNQANFDENYGGFVNQNKDVIKNMLSKSSEWDSFIEYYWPTTIGWPDVKIKEATFNKDKFMSDDELSFAWLGHSTVLLRINGTNVLIDPVFSDFASPLSFIAKRFQKPVVNLEDLPPIDYVIISHDHYDHLDRESVQFFKDKKETKFYVPLGVQSHLRYWGLKNMIIDFNWWGSVDIAGVKFTFTPAQHFSGRVRFIDNNSVWGGWVIESGGKTVFFSGDTGYASHFKEIAKRFPKIDLAFMENGQYDWRWQAVHMMPSETAQAFRDLGAKKMVPIHWGMFNFSLHNWFDPPLDLKKNCEDCELIIPQIGEVISAKDIENEPKEMLQFLMDQKERFK